MVGDALVNGQWHRTPFLRALLATLFQFDFRSLNGFTIGSNLFPTRGRVARSSIKERKQL
jgi:hypothetical protein